MKHAWAISLVAMTLVANAAMVTLAINGPKARSEKKPEPALTKIEPKHKATMPKREGSAYVNGRRVW